MISLTCSRCMREKFGAFKSPRLRLVSSQIKKAGGRGWNVRFILTFSLFLCLVLQSQHQNQSSSQAPGSKVSAAGPSFIPRTIKAARVDKQHIMAHLMSRNCVKEIDRLFESGGSGKREQTVHI